MPAYFIPQGVGTPSDIVSFLLLGLRNFISVAPDLLDPFELDLNASDSSVTFNDSELSVEFDDSQLDVEFDDSETDVEFADEYTEVEIV